MSDVPQIFKKEQWALVSRMLILAEGAAYRQGLERDASDATVSRITEFRICSGYANKGEGDPGCALVVLGDWNKVTVQRKGADGRYYYEPVSDMPKRIAHMLERYGVGVGWADMWAVCDSCNKAVETEPTHWEWMPKYKVLEGELLCFPCLEEKAKEDAEEAEDDDDGDEDSCALEHAEP